MAFVRSVVGNKRVCVNVCWKMFKHVRSEHQSKLTLFKSSMIGLFHLYPGLHKAFPLSVGKKTCTNLTHLSLSCQSHWWREEKGKHISISKPTVVIVDNGFSCDGFSVSWINTALLDARRVVLLCSNLCTIFARFRVSFFSDPVRLTCRQKYFLTEGSYQWTTACRFWKQPVSAQNESHVIGIGLATHVGLQKWLKHLVVWSCFLLEAFSVDWIFQLLVQS